MYKSHEYKSRYVIYNHYYHNKISIAIQKRQNSIEKK